MTDDGLHTLDGMGDAIRGEKVVCTCRKVGEPRPFHMTSGHRGRRVILKGNVRCVIEAAFHEPSSPTT